MGTSISLGNLKVVDLETRMGWLFTEEDKSFLEFARTDIADFKEKDKLHIFDVPFEVSIGEDIYDDVVKMLSSYNNANKGLTKLLVTKKVYIKKPKPLTREEKREKVFEYYIEQLTVEHKKRKSQKAFVAFEDVISKLVTARPCMTSKELTKLNEVLRVCKYAAVIVFEEHSPGLFCIRMDMNSYYLTREKFMKRWYWEKTLASGKRIRGWVTTVADFKEDLHKAITGRVELERKADQYSGIAIINEVPNEEDTAILEYKELYKLKEGEKVTFAIEDHLVEPWVYPFGYPANEENLWPTGELY